jgi:branched-chain amino acid transport system substrate-binding protein
MLLRLKPILFAPAALLLLSFSLTGAAAADRIVIGQAVDLSGPDASIGRDYVAGIKTYFDMVNSTGGINGKRIQYIARDDRGQAELSANIAADLIERVQADYLMGGIGDGTTQAVLNAPAFKRSGQVLFAPLAAADYAPTAPVLFWRPSYRQEIRHILSHFSKVGISDVGVVYQETPSNAQAYNSLTAAIQEHRLTVKATSTIGPNGDQIVAESARMAAAKPGFIIVLADTICTAQFLKAYRRHDAQTFVAGTSLTNLSTLQEVAGRRAMEWTVFAQVVPNPNAGTSLLQIEHLNGMKKYRDEAVSSLTLEGFAAAKALVKAIQHSKRNGRNALRDFAEQYGNMDLGGLPLMPAKGGNRLSGYVEIALFRKGSGLMY